jgi:hypothetical protein
MRARDRTQGQARPSASVLQQQQQQQQDSAGSRVDVSTLAGPLLSPPPPLPSPEEMRLFKLQQQQQQQQQHQQLDPVPSQLLQPAQQQTPAQQQPAPPKRTAGQTCVKGSFAAHLESIRLASEAQRAAAAAADATAGGTDASLAPCTPTTPTPAAAAALSLMSPVSALTASAAAAPEHPSLLSPVAVSTLSERMRRRHAILAELLGPSVLLGPLVGQGTFSEIYVAAVAAAPPAAGASVAAAAAAIAADPVLFAIKVEKGERVSLDKHMLRSEAELLYKLQARAPVAGLHAYLDSQCAFALPSSVGLTLAHAIAPARRAPTAAGAAASVGGDSVYDAGGAVFTRGLAADCRDELAPRPSRATRECAPALTPSGAASAVRVTVPAVMLPPPARLNSNVELPVLLTAATLTSLYHHVTAAGIAAQAGAGASGNTVCNDTAARFGAALAVASAAATASRWGRIRSGAKPCSSNSSSSNSSSSSSSSSASDSGDTALSSAVAAAAVAPTQLSALAMELVGPDVAFVRRLDPAEGDNLKVGFGWNPAPAPQASPADAPDADRDAVAIVDASPAALSAAAAAARFTDTYARLGVQTAAHLGRHMLACLQAMHEAGYVHRDVKPSNFALPFAQALPRVTDLKILDFGLAREYVNPATGAVLPPRPNADFRGTVMYASLRAHELSDLGRADDLWSLFFLIVDIALGVLPWRNVKTSRQRVYQSKKIFLAGIAAAVEARADEIDRPGQPAVATLARGRGDDRGDDRGDGQYDDEGMTADAPATLPCELLSFADHISQCAFETEPNYAFLRQLLVRLEARARPLPLVHRPAPVPMAWLPAAAAASAASK